MRDVVMNADKPVFHPFDTSLCSVEQQVIDQHVVSGTASRPCFSLHLHITGHTMTALAPVKQRRGNGEDPRPTTIRSASSTSREGLPSLPFPAK